MEHNKPFEQCRLFVPPSNPSSSIEGAVVQAGTSPESECSLDRADYAGWSPAETRVSLQLSLSKDPPWWPLEVLSPVVLSEITITHEHLWHAGWSTTGGREMGLFPLLHIMHSEMGLFQPINNDNFFFCPSVMDRRGVY